jgi:DNA repair exonuclease SbcCD ATPase subunit
MSLTKQDLTGISKIVQTQIHGETRKIINGQSAMKSELLGKIGKLDGKIDQLDKKLSGKIDSLDKKIDGVEERLTKRIDKIGLSVAQLQDDAPTIKEFDKLEKRVTKVEVKVASV